MGGNKEEKSPPTMMETVIALPQQIHTQKGRFFVLKALEFDTKDNGHYCRPIQSILRSQSYNN